MENTMKTNAFQAAPDRKKLFTLLALFIGLIGNILVSSTQSTMLPIAAAEIGGADYYTLVSALSGVVGVMFLPLFGYISAKNPSIKGRLMAFSLIVNAAVFFSRAFVTSMWQIIIPGLIYGLYPPTIYVLGYSYIRDIYDQKKAAFYLGFTATMVSIAQLAGPTIGGIIMDRFGWRAMNHLVWPFMLLAGIFALMGVNVKREEVKELARDAKFDFWGAVSITVFLACLTLALSLASSFAPFGGTFSNILLVLAVVALISFILSIRKMKSDAFLPLGVLKDKNTLCLTLAQFFTNLHTMSTIIFLPMFILSVLQQSATMSGLCTTMYAVAGLFMGPIFGKIIAKQGTVKPVLIFGNVLKILVTATYAIILTPACSVYAILGLQLVSGIFNAQSSVTFSVGPQLMLKEDVRIQGNSVIQTVQTLGSTLAVSIYTMIIGMFGALTGIRMCFVVATVFAVLTLISGLMLKKEGEK